MKGTLIFDDDAMREVIQMIVEGMNSPDSLPMNQLTVSRQVGWVREDGDRQNQHSRHRLERLRGANQPQRPTYQDSSKPQMRLVQFETQ